MEFNFQEFTNKGYIRKFTIETSAPCKQELGPWFENVECNIEQIFKVLKGILNYSSHLNFIIHQCNLLCLAYSDSNKEREIGLDICKKEFDSIITVKKGETLECTVVELGTADTYYFQIKWKLVPSPKHFAKVRNVCRIACTEDGMHYLFNCVTSGK